jgi:beta-glucosidase
VARRIVAGMSLREEVGLVGLWSGWHGYENANAGAACLPRLTLSDGSQGVAYGPGGMTQLPAPIGLGSTFSAGLARRYGDYLGTEADDDGLDVLQAPDLNLVRVPNSGRSFETLGEDPVLAGDLGAAEVEGIDAEHVLAEPKHLGVYTQETDRPYLDQEISERSLQEVYLAPFATAVRTGRALALMCAYGEIDGTPSCADPDLYGSLRSWGFDGLVRSDQDALQPDDTLAGFESGLDLLKPAQSALLEQAVQSGALPRSVLDAAVERVIAVMDTDGLLGAARQPDRRALARARLPAAVLGLTEASMVLLKDAGAVLPLRGSSGTIAVIGTDAGSGAVSSGLGSSYVPEAPSQPAEALAAAFPGRTRYVAAGLRTPRSTVFSPGRPGQVTVDPPQPAGSPPEDASTASLPQGGPGWSESTASFSAPASGTYVVELTSDGDAFLDGPAGLVVGDAGAQEAWTDSATVRLRAGEDFDLSLDWYSAAYPEPRVTLQDATPAIEQAAGAARRARTAVVFAGVEESEGMDRQTLELPGDEDELIEAVAAANPHTVVVLNSGGAVLMPWLSEVQGVLEAWYPGIDDGTATAAVLDGQADPSGRLPLSFPASDATSATAAPATFPGVDGTVVIDGDGADGLDIGYRWYEANGVAPLFPFGFGLSYTTFSLSRLVLRRAAAPAGGPAPLVASVRVRNTGRRAGTEVVQAYLSFPASAGEPPQELKAFTTVTLGAGASTTARLRLPASAFETFQGGAFAAVAGRFVVRVGTSSSDLPLQAPVVVAAVPPAARGGPSGTTVGTAPPT